MLRIARSKISRRIAVTVGLTMMIAGVPGVLLLLDSVARTQEEAASRLLTTLAGAVVASYDTFDERHGRHPAGEMTAALSARSDLRNLDVFAADGRIRWSIDPARSSTPVEPMILAAVMSRTATAGRVVAEADALSAGTVVLPIRKRSSCLPCHASSRDPIGGVHVSASRGSLFESLASLSLPALGITVLLVALITGLMLTLVQRRILAPLHDLVAVMARAEEGDFFVRAEVRSNDEVALLASTFNKMLATITDLQVEGIESERELLDARGGLHLKAELEEKSAALEQANARLEALSMTDGLTGVPNRRALEQRMELEWLEAARYNDALSVIMLDIDKFKRFNDEHGHLVGDEALRGVAQVLATNVRKVDGLGRYGGEEFMVVLPRLVKSEALSVANKLRVAVEASEELRSLGPVTISCGVASYPQDATTRRELVGAADAALFRAKRRGRNRVEAARARLTTTDFPPQP